MRTLLYIFICITAAVCASAQNGFKVIPLGVKGGNEEGNLSSYLVAPEGSDAYLCLDAGTVNAGIRKAIELGIFSVPEQVVLKSYIKGYLISHAHLDHVSGMLINAVDDTTKRIYASESCIEMLKANYFNWQAWPNFGSEGAEPTLKKYIYTPLKTGEETIVEHTAMKVRAFPLSHGPAYESTAFLIQNKNKYLLYFGDTGPDAIEKSDRMRKVWEAVAPLVAAKKLAGIFLEVSYPNSQPDGKLFGHLTPKWFMQEMSVLGELAGRENLSALNVVVTHLKPPAEKEKTIREELEAANNLGLHLIFPDQGKLLLFK